MSRVPYHKKHSGHSLSRSQLAGWELSSPRVRPCTATRWGARRCRWMPEHQRPQLCRCRLGGWALTASEPHGRLCIRITLAGGKGSIASGLSSRCAFSEDSPCKRGQPTKEVSGPLGCLYMYVPRRRRRERNMLVMPACQGRFMLFVQGNASGRCRRRQAYLPGKQGRRILYDDALPSSVKPGTSVSERGGVLESWSLPIIHHYAPGEKRAPGKRVDATLSREGGCRAESRISVRGWPLSVEYMHP